MADQTRAGVKLARARFFVSDGKLGQNELDRELGVPAGRTAKYEKGPGPRGISDDYREAWNRKYAHRLPFDYVDDPSDDWPDTYVTVRMGAGSGKTAMMVRETVAKYGAEDPRAEMRYLGTVPCADVEDRFFEAGGSIRVDARFAGPKRFVTRIATKALAPALVENDLAVWETDEDPPLDSIALARDGETMQVWPRVATFDDSSAMRVYEQIAPSAPEGNLGSWEVHARLIGVQRIEKGAEKTFFRPEGLTRENMVPKP